MMQRTFMKRPIRQVAYYVPDARKAAEQHAAAFGSGPYFVMDHIPMCLARYVQLTSGVDHPSGL